MQCMLKLQSFVCRDDIHWYVTVTVCYFNIDLSVISTLKTLPFQQITLCGINNSLNWHVIQCNMNRQLCVISAVCISDILHKCNSNAIFFLQCVSLATRFTLLLQQINTGIHNNICTKNNNYTLLQQSLLHKTDSVCLL